MLQWLFHQLLLLLHTEENQKEPRSNRQEKGMTGGGGAVGVGEWVIVTENHPQNKETQIVETENVYLIEQTFSLHWWRHKR